MSKLSWCIFNLKWLLYFSG